MTPSSSIQERNLMTPLQQKLNQLNLSTMSRQLETTLTEAATKSLSAAATLEWLTDMEIEARSQRAIERRFRCSRLQAQPSIDAFHLGVATLERRSKRQDIGVADLVRCGISSSDQSRRRGRWL